MLLAFSLLALASLQNDVPSRDEGFAQSYGVFVSQDENQCIYWLTHVGLDAAQLTKSLKRGGYVPARGLEILVEPDTPGQCIAEAIKSASKAGFEKVRVRPKSKGDRPPSIL